MRSLISSWLKSRHSVVLIRSSWIRRLSEEDVDPEHADSCRPNLLTMPTFHITGHSGRLELGRSTSLSSDLAGANSQRAGLLHIRETPSHLILLSFALATMYGHTRLKPTRALHQSGS